jgi:hypothetical protein
MDELQRSIYGDRFRADFHSKKGTEFQDWFVRIAGFAFGPDFEAVRPYGSQGDLKCDGRRISSKSIFQCYAPYSMKGGEVVAKINEDFHGARVHWAAEMREWIFVHNDGRGLPPNVVRDIEGLRTSYSPIRIETWSEPELLKLAMALDLSALQALFSYAPSIELLDRLVMADLVPIIDALERQEPNPNDPTLAPPSPKKLEKNALSGASAELLRFGRRKAVLVETFFRKNSRADLGERIAEAFRNRYADLKNIGLPADKIFKHLQDYAGMNGDPERQCAALAVLSYFFESCDIFEDPVTAADAS